MHFISGFLRTIILLGAVQGFILCSLLFFSAKNKPANRLLATLIFLISLASLKLYGMQQGWFNTIPLLGLMNTFIPMIIVMPIGPLIYFYIKSSLNPHFRLTKKERIHFLPVLIDLVPQLTAIVFFLGVLTHTVRNNPDPWGQFIDTYNVYSDIPRWISVSWYVWMAASHLSKEFAIQHVENARLLTQPLQPAVQFKWLRQFIRLFQVFQGIWLIYLIPYVIPRYTDWLLNWVDWYPVYVPLAVLIYWLGIKGYIISQREFPVKKETGSQSFLTAAEVEHAIKAVEKSMTTDKLYLNPTLTVAQLAWHTRLPQKTISAVLNQHLHKSFNEFVNGYRILEIKERLLQPESKDLTIAGLAYECGFNSQPTFQRAFKSITGLTPKEFLLKNASASC